MDPIVMLGSINIYGYVAYWLWEPDVRGPFSTLRPNYRMQSLR